MRRKEIRPFAVFLLVVIVLIALVVATRVKTTVPLVADSDWRDLIFWLVFMGISGPGYFITGRFFNKGGR